MSEGVIVTCRLPLEAVLAIDRQIAEEQTPGGRSAWLRALVLYDLGLPDPGDGRNARKAERLAREAAEKGN